MRDYIDHEGTCNLVVAVFVQAVRDARTGDVEAREWLKIVAPDYYARLKPDFFDLNEVQKKGRQPNFLSFLSHKKRGNHARAKPIHE